MTWHTGPMMAFDVETSGVSSNNDRLVTIALVYANASIGPAVDARHWVLNCGVDIPDEAAAIHGYTTERVQAEGADPEPVVIEVAQRLHDHMAQGLPVVGFNVAFDFGFLNAELVRHDLAPLDPRPVVDPLVIDKAVDRYRRGRRTLTASAEHYRVTLDGAHDATADALAAARLAWRVGQLDQVAAMTLDELHDAQVGWAQEQAASLRQYFESQGKPFDDVNGDWPVRYG